MEKKLIWINMALVPQIFLNLKEEVDLFYYFIFA